MKVKLLLETKNGETKMKKVSKIKILAVFSDNTNYYMEVAGKSKLDALSQLVENLKVENLENAEITHIHFEN